MLAESHAQAKQSKESKKMRGRGRALLDPEMLLFTCVRYDARRPLVRYGEGPAQKLVAASGYDKLRQEYQTIAELECAIACEHMLLLLTRICANLFACSGRSFKLRMPQIYAFAVAFAQRTGCYKTMPNATPRLLEMMFYKQFQGIPIGYQRPESGARPNSRGWAPGPFDSESKNKSASNPGITRVPALAAPRCNHCRDAAVACKVCQLRHLRAELATDVQVVLRRCLLLAQRDVLLFRTRVMYYDSVVPDEDRFTTPPRPKERVQKESQGMGICAGRKIGFSACGDWADDVSSEASDEATESQYGAVHSDECDIHERDESDRPSSLMGSAAGDGLDLPEVVEKVCTYMIKTQPGVAAEFGIACSETVEPRKQDFTEDEKRRWGARLGVAGRCHGRAATSFGTAIAGHGVRAPCVWSGELTVRRCRLEDAADSFHVNGLIFQQPVTNVICSSQEARYDCVRRLHRHCSRAGGIIATPNWRPTVREDTPVEATEVVSDLELVQQYQRLQALVSEIVNTGAHTAGLETVSARSLYKAEGLEVRFKGASATELVDFSRFSVPRKLHVDAERLHCLRSAVARLRGGDETAIVALRGLPVHVTGRGSVHIVSARMRLSDADLQALIITIPYEVVHIRQVWQIIKVNHRFFIQASAMEIVNESIGSDLRYLERRACVGARPSLQKLVCATRLRFSGLRGNIFDVGTVFNALCPHFGTDDPSEFHFCRKRQRLPTGGRMLMDEKYVFGPSCTLARTRANEYERQMRKPSWFSQRSVYAGGLPSQAAPTSWTARGMKYTFPAPVWQELDKLMRRHKCA